MKIGQLLISILIFILSLMAVAYLVDQNEMYVGLAPFIVLPSIVYIRDVIRE